MDKVIAKRIEQELTGKHVRDWLIESVIDNGKSAVVLKGTSGNLVGAIKIFDPDLVEKQGKDSQLARIDREKGLIGKHHKNLVKIYDGGLCADTGYCFIAMEYLEGNNLAKDLAKVSCDNICGIVRKIASAAKFLEDNGYCHRDIKPENILYKGGDDIILLDLGVMRPIEGSSLTDDDNIRPFIGTLQYSPPEFLLRKESETTEGLRAITFYQIGAVLHDLIMKKPLFDNFKNPYANLVNAVQQENPDTHNNSISPKIRALAANCLVKDPAKRLQLVSWLDLLELSSEDKGFGELQQRIKSYRIAASCSSLQPSSAISCEESLKKIGEEILECTRSRCIASKLFPRFLTTISDVDKEEVSLEVAFRFEKDTGFGLNSFLSLFVEIKLVDSSAEVVSVGIAGFLTENNFCDRNELEFEFKKVLISTYDCDLFSLKVYQMICKIYDSTINKIVEPLTSETFSVCF
ncbi:Serine/threonine protein kinase [Desulfovibrio sp. DV]|uniref:protein kinase domain-containing protein n=1 Tax=Desulfovibrio sp. DV TaxID=1844708 RepID=UPI00094B8F0A|nr:protein kinase [Desulfovibrio sp. DV]OLN24903.1 Serine/threonine protein kinase [Desulfovibrio sp. DV]